MAWFTNFYRCSECGGTWHDDWSATCDDDCPHCGARHMSPCGPCTLVEAGDQKFSDRRRPPRHHPAVSAQASDRQNRCAVSYPLSLRPHLGRAGRVAHRLATGPQARGAPDVCWCRPGRRPRSGRRQQACAADRPAAPCSSTPSSCHQVCSALRAAPQAPPGDQQGDLFWAKRIWSWKCSASPGRGSMPG